MSNRSAGVDPGVLRHHRRGGRIQLRDNPPFDDPQLLVGDQVGLVDQDEIGNRDVRVDLWVFLTERADVRGVDDVDQTAVAEAGGPVRP